MTRPVRPIALVLLTACMAYPGVTMLYQGLYPIWSGDFFNLVGQHGLWMDIGIKLGLPPMAISGAKALVGLMWLGGVLGLWAGDSRAYPLALAAAVLSLLYPGGPMVMAAIGLICLLLFRENPDEVPA